MYAVQSTSSVLFIEAVQILLALDHIVALEFSYTSAPLQAPVLPFIWLRMHYDACIPGNAGPIFVEGAAL